MATKEFPGTSSGKTQNEIAPVPGASGNTIPFGIAPSYRQQQAEVNAPAGFSNAAERISYLNAMTITNFNIQIANLLKVIAGREPDNQFPTIEESGILYKLTKCIANLQHRSVSPKPASKTIQRWKEMVNSLNP